MLVSTEAGTVLVASCVIGLVLLEEARRLSPGFRTMNRFFLRMASHWPRISVALSVKRIWVDGVSAPSKAPPLSAKRFPMMSWLG